ncbi:MAG: hypothetical protein G01um10143_288 [Parcubacteria group bacterium Gr01-1014_3]|nr:MAG: hypothetical protein G01um10143_288 [Parcubacteria group bacterium Gr01-1014_3]
MMNKADLRKKFDELPDKIREWLTSERATYVVIDINERLDMAGPLVKIIPTTILRLVTKDIEPGEFINILSEELDIDFNSAKNIAQEIEEKILRPIEGQLRREADIDIKLIYFAKPGPGHPEAQPKELEILLRQPADQNDSITPAPAQPIQTPIAIRVEPPKVVVEPPVRQIPTPPPIPQNRPTFQPLRPPIVRLPINFPKPDQNQ